MFDTDEAPAQPKLDSATLESLQQTLKQQGPERAIDALCENLLKIEDYDGLFYGLLMKKRVELGVSPFPMGPASDLPPETHEPYEESIRQAGRKVGQLLLEKHNVRRAWFFFNMLGEPAPVKTYLDTYEPTDADDIQGIVDVALYQGVHPAKGFDLIVDRFGICNAITTYGGQDFSRNPAAKQHCIRRLVTTLYEQLRERLRSDIESRGTTVPAGATVAEMVHANPDVFADGCYHIDTSHLSSVAQMSLELENCPEMALAEELCLYGEKLGSTFQHDSDPPFENTYHDYRILLSLFQGREVDAGLAHFQSKIVPNIEQQNTFPAEIYVNILIRLKRRAEALEVAKKYLAGETRALACPSVYDLCRDAKDDVGLAETAKQRADGITFLAALIAAKKS